MSTARWIARATVLLALGIIILLFANSPRAETSIAIGADIYHASGDPMLFVRRSVTPEWSVYVVSALGQNDAFGIAVDYSARGWGALDRWSGFFGAVGWNNTNSLNGTPLNFWFGVRRRLNAQHSAGWLHTSAGGFLGLTDESNAGRNVVFIERNF